MDNETDVVGCRCRFADTEAILILPSGHPIMIVETNVFLCGQLISMFIMGCPGGKSIWLPYLRNGVLKVTRNLLPRIIPRAFTSEKKLQSFPSLYSQLSVNRHFYKTGTWCLDCKTVVFFTLVIRTRAVFEQKV